MGLKYKSAAKESILKVFKSRLDSLKECRIAFGDVHSSAYLIFDEIFEFSKKIENEEDSSDFFKPENFSEEIDKIFEKSLIFERAIIDQAKRISELSPEICKKEFLIYH